MKTSFQQDTHLCPKSDSSFPSFRQRRHWYDLPLLCHPADPTRGISYETQANAMRNALNHAGVLASKATHENRRFGARLAEAGGASYSEIARAEGWATGGDGDGPLLTSPSSGNASNRRSSQGRRIIFPSSCGGGAREPPAKGLP